MKKQNATTSNFLQTWAQLSRPNIWRSILNIVLYCIYESMKLLDAIFAANAVTGLTNQDWSYAYMSVGFLGLGIIVRNVIAQCIDLNRAKLYAGINSNISSKLYKKLLYANSSNFERTSKEYILNTISSNVDVMSQFIHNISARIAYMVKLAIALVVIFNSNVFAGLIVIGLGIIDFFILKWLNTRSARASAKLYNARDAIDEEVSGMIHGHSIISEFEKEREYERRFNNKVDDVNKYVRESYIVAGYKSNFFYIFYRVMLCLVNMLLVLLVSKGTMTLAVYMVIVSYILDCTEQFNNVFDITSIFSNLQVSVNRVETIINFTEEEFAKFGNIIESHGGNNLSLVGVSYLETRNGSQYRGVLHDVDISFIPRAVNLVKGPRNCGKRLVFNMLRRNTKPEKGTIVYDNINLYRYSTKDYKKKIYYTVRQPDFLVGTIYENLSLSGANKTKINEVCRRLGIYDYIRSLPKKFNTPISEDMPRLFKFLLGLARAVLTGCEVLMVYEVPSALSNADKLMLMHTFEDLAKDHTIILFSYGNLFDNISKIIYKIDNGRVINVKVN